MSDLLQLLPIYAFMLIPVWIPLAAVTVGALADLLDRARPARQQAHPARRVSSSGPRVPAAGTAR